MTENRIDTSQTYNLRGIQWHGTIVNVQQPDWVSVRCVKMPAELVAGPRRFPIVLDRDQAYLSFEYNSMPTPLYTYYDYDAKLISVIKVTRD